MKKSNIASAIWILVLLIFGMPLVVFAEDGGASSDQVSPYMAERRELWELKQKDPEAFRAKITELRNNAQKRLDSLKETDPETYQRVIERRQKRIEPRFEHFREENPEAYQRIERHREGLIQKRVDWVRKNDPERYARMEQRWHQNPNRFEPEPTAGAPQRRFDMQRPERWDGPRHDRWNERNPGPNHYDPNRPNSRPAVRRGVQRRQNGR